MESLNYILRRWVAMIMQWKWKDFVSTEKVREADVLLLNDVVVGVLLSSQGF